MTKSPSAKIGKSKILRCSKAIKKSPKKVSGIKVTKLAKFTQDGKKNLYKKPVEIARA